MVALNSSEHQQRDLDLEQCEGAKTTNMIYPKAELAIGEPSRLLHTTHTLKILEDQFWAWPSSQGLGRVLGRGDADSTRQSGRPRPGQAQFSNLDLLMPASQNTGESHKYPLGLATAPLMRSLPLVPSVHSTAFRLALPISRTD